MTQSGRRGRPDCRTDGAEGRSALAVLVDQHDVQLIVDPEVDL
jgi:hypothetical protein